MADRATIDDTLAGYYRAWTERDVALYRTVWTEDATFADPPTDGELAPTGIDEIVAGMDAVWSNATAISYNRSHTFHCGHNVAVHMVVSMTMLDGGGRAEIPLIHVFRFAEDGRIRRLEAFLDLELLEMVEGRLPAWLGGRVE